MTYYISQSFSGIFRRRFIFSASYKSKTFGDSVSSSNKEMAGTTGYSEDVLLEKWARDSKILDIFEGTQQIQQLVVARRLLGLSSAELK